MLCVGEAWTSRRAPHLVALLWLQFLVSEFARRLRIWGQNPPPHAFSRVPEGDRPTRNRRQIGVRMAYTYTVTTAQSYKQLGPTEQRVGRKEKGGSSKMSLLQCQVNGG